MAHHGYIPYCKQFIHSLRTDVPHVMEVGIDRGVTLLPLAAFMARTREKFVLVGVDVLVQEQVDIVSRNLDLMPSQRLHLVQGNSLNVLPEMVQRGLKFDLVLIDGDHNYYTVQKELEHISALVHPHSLIVIDDYEGRWSDRDLWYSERPEYVDVKDTTVPVQTQKHGVKVAVDEFVRSRPEWQMFRPLGGEPVLLMQGAI